MVALEPPIPSFIVKDLESAKKLLTENGCKVIQEREKIAYYKDKNGHIFDNRGKK